MTSGVRVVIVDDHPLVVDGLRMALELADMDVVETAATAAAAVDAVRRRRPDVVVMDIQLPDASGIDATRAVLEAAPDTAVLMLTMLEERDTLAAAMRAGARGYVVKGASRDEIVRAVTAVADGQVIFGSRVADDLLAEVMALPHSRRFDGRALTDREHQILAGLADGLTNGAIAARLGISAKTVANHVSTLLTKLQVTDRAQAALLAREYRRR